MAPLEIAQLLFDTYDNDDDVQLSEWRAEIIDLCRAYVNLAGGDDEDE